MNKKIIIPGREFRFDRLVLEGIDNSSVVRRCGCEILEEESCLFHQDMSCGDDYFKGLHSFVYDALCGRNAAPVVRFADGEYAFYAYSLHCNGLYQQAESVEAIKEVMPTHLKALKVLNQSGKFAPLIFSGNVQHKRKTLFSYLGKWKGNDSALQFVEFLFHNKIELTRENYLPFYVVYAYLTSKLFCEVVDKKKLCIINSECNMDLCRRWFARFSSSPDIVFVKIPDSYVATQWGAIKQEVFSRIPPETDLCLSGAGIGALLVCVDVASEFLMPVIDAGHVLNMMNGREDKSNGSRLYTIREALGGGFLC